MSLSNIKTLFSFLAEAKNTEGLILIKPPMVADDNKTLFLDENYEVVDTANNTVYTRDRSIPLADVVFKDIPGLGNPAVGGARTLAPLLLILGHAYKPLQIPTSDLEYETETGYEGPTIELLYKDDSPNTNIPPESLFWVFPKNGVHVDRDSGYRYVPMVKNCIVSTNGHIFNENKGIFQKGNNRDNYAVESSIVADTIVEIEQSVLVKLAFGLYDQTNYLETPVTPIDDSFVPDENFVSTYTRVAGKTIAKT